MRRLAPLLLILLPACTVPIEGQVDVDRMPPIRGDIHTTTDARLVGGNLHADANLNGRLALEGPVNINISGPSVRYQGTFVPQTSFERIATGTTRADWVLAVLGKPDTASTLDDGTLVWKYQYAPIEQSSGSLVTLFGSSKDEPQPQPVITILRLDKGVVVEKWRD